MFENYEKRKQVIASFFVTISQIGTKLKANNAFLFFIYLHYKGYVK